MTREDKIKLALVLIAISSYAVGFTPLGHEVAKLVPLGQRIGGSEVI
jgi:hypothetical protein